MLRTVRTLAVLVGLAANLIPLYGVLYWQWDTFQLLMLYWMETVIIAFWTIRRIARVPIQELGTITVNGRVRPATRKMLCGFFTLHAGLFIAAHLLFLWILFSGEWLKKVHGVASFSDELFFANGLWLAIAFMFVSGWISYLVSTSQGYPRQMERGLYPKKKIAPAPEAGNDAVGSIVGGLYVRIVIMQIAIIAGAVLAQRYGSIAPLLIVIGLKTLADMAASIRGSSAPEGMTLSSGNTTLKT
ncbi:MAG: hypothetical protein K2Y71_00215 [Xanthobacteraceae bacterium]|nr:hypothetical protein [Xanthobacteraceae bacterium]